MLQLNQTRVSTSNERKLATGVVLTEEGVALVAVYENGELCVKPSTGANKNEVFVGIALSAVATPTVAPMVENIVVPKETPYTVELLKEPVAETELFIKGFTKNGSASSQGQFKLTKSTLEFHEDDKGKALTVTYAYSPTVAELSATQGQPAPGEHVTTCLGQTGVITSGEVFTSAYDPKVDWTPNSDGIIKVYLGANGRFTTNTTGVEVHAIVTHIPQAGSPFLGLQFRA